MRHMTQKLTRILNELEKAHIYIDPLQKLIEKLKTAAQPNKQ